MFDDDTSLHEAKKRPPRPTTQYVHVPVAPIMSNQFPPFSYFFICVHKATNMHNCSLQSLYLLIRTHPSLQPIMTPNAWCNDSEANFNVGYSLDFTNVPHFSLGDFTPVVEVYIRYPKKSQLVGIAFLPLRVLEITSAEGKPMTYLYRDTPIDIKDVTTRRVVGTVVVTVALGEREHQRILDPNAPKQVQSAMQPQPQVKPAPLRSKQRPKRRKSSYSEYDYESDYDSEEEDELDWMSEAMKHGWVKPGSMGNWKEKAKKKGWTPPEQKAFYTTGTECDLMNTAAKTEAVIQVDLDLPDIEELKPVDEDVKSDIMQMFSSSNSAMQIEEQAIFSSDSGKGKKPKRLKMSAVKTVFSEKPKSEKNDDDEISDIHQSILNLATGNQAQDQEDDDDSTLDESLMKQVSEIKTQNTMKILSESNSDDSESKSDMLSASDDDFKPLNEEETETSELIVSGGRKSSSSGKSSGSGKLQSIPITPTEEESSSAIFHSPVRTKSPHSTSDSNEPPKAVEEEEDTAEIDSQIDESYKRIMDDPMLKMLSQNSNSDEEEEESAFGSIKESNDDLALKFGTQPFGESTDLKLKYSDATKSLSISNSQKTATAPTPQNTSAQTGTVSGSIGKTGTISDSLGKLQTISGSNSQKTGPLSEPSPDKMGTLSGSNSQKLGTISASSSQKTDELQLTITSEEPSEEKPKPDSRPQIAPLSQEDSQSFQYSVAGLDIDSDSESSGVF